MKNIAQYMETAAELIDLPIDPEYRPGVIANLERIAEMVRLITEFPLDLEMEPAPVFYPSNQNPQIMQITQMENELATPAGKPRAIPQVSVGMIGETGSM